MPAEIIVALDVADESTGWACIEQLDPAYCALKIGSEWFTRCGPAIVERCIHRGFRVFLDLKFYDIPTTVMKAACVAADLGVWMLTVHASGGEHMLRQTREALAAYGGKRPLMIAVTVLTSQTDRTLREIGVSAETPEQVQQLAQLAYASGVDGVVCAAGEVPEMKAAFGSTFLTVTPGLRLPGDVAHDQVRVFTPQEASRLGSDYLVLGRTVTTKSNPGVLVQQLYHTLRAE